MSSSWENMVLVGKVSRSHGNKGQVIVNPETDFPERRFSVGQTMFVNRDDAVKPLTVTSVRFQRGRPILGLMGMTTMSDAEALAGFELRIPVEFLETLPQGMFYRHDLIGCAVWTVEGTDVGTVADVEGSLEGGRLVVRNEVEEVGRDVLIPLVEAICVQIDITGRQITIDPPVGLLELNA